MQADDDIPISDLVDEVTGQIRDLEAEIVQARLNYPKQALAARVAAIPAQRAEAQSKATALNETIKRNRATIDELKPILAQAKLEYIDVEVEQRRLRTKAFLRETATQLKRREELAAKAEALLSEFAGLMFEVVQLGRAAHQRFAGFVSTDQAHACTPDETWIAQCVVGLLLRNGAITTHALGQLSSLGVDGLQSRESIASAISTQDLLMLSRFGPELFEDEPPEPVRRNGKAPLVGLVGKAA